MGLAKIKRLSTPVVRKGRPAVNCPGRSLHRPLARVQGAAVTAELSGRVLLGENGDLLAWDSIRARVLWGVLLWVFLARGNAMSESVPRFTNITRSSHINFRHVNGRETNKVYLFEAKGSGAGFFDFDNDGWMDLLMVQGSTLERFRKGDDLHCSLYRNQGDGTFKDITGESGLTRTAWGMGVTFGDYDNDGFVDIYLNNLGTNFLYRNRGDGTFEDVTARAGVGDSGWTASSAFGDYDQDGDLDLYICNYIHYDFDNLRPPDPKLICHYRGATVPCGPLGLQGRGQSALPQQRRRHV